MNRSVAAALVGLGVVVGAFGVSLFDAEADADVSVSTTYRTVDAVVDEIHIHYATNGAVQVVTATICGHTKTSTGVVLPSYCAPDIELATTGAQGTIRTDLLTLRNGGALTYWKTKYPPEQPGL